MKNLLLILTVSCVIFACRSEKEEEYKPESPTQSFGKTFRQDEPNLGQNNKAVELAKLYTGTLPCTDCDKREVTLMFNTDGTYYLEETFHGNKKESFYNFGLWKMINDSTAWLRGGALGYSGQAAMWFFKSTGKDSLKMLGQNMQDTLNNKFILTASDKDFKPDTPFKMSGLFSMKDGKAVFRECVTQKLFTVAKEKGFQQAAQEYKKLDKAEGQLQIFAIVMAYPSGDHPATGDVKQHELIITELMAFEPETVCEPVEIETPEPVQRESY